MNEEQLTSAFRLWYASFEHVDTDRLVEPFLMAEAKTGWLRRAREALSLASDVVARMMKLSEGAYRVIEMDETQCTLRELQLIARAMDCELVYAIRPASGQRFSQMVWSEALNDVLSENAILMTPAALKAHAISAAVRRRLG